MEQLGKQYSCKIDDFSINYHKCGSGPQVLLLHGITTYSFIWRQIVPILKEHFEVYTLDLVGCGDSDKPLNIPYSLKNHALIMNQFTEKVGLKDFHLIGHDLGGGIAQIFAVHHEKKLKTVTLINSVGYDYWPVQPIVAMKTPIIRQMAMATLDLGAFKMIVKRGMYHKEKVDHVLMGHFWKPMRTKIGRKAFLHFAGSLDNHDLMSIKKEISNLQVPVFIIRGDNDVYLSSGIAEQLHAEIKGSELLRIDTAGHFIQEDEPQLLGNAIKEFITGHND